MNKLFLVTTLSLSSVHLTACIGCYNPTGCTTDTSPYYITKTTTHIRGITIPPQTKLKYKSLNFSQKDQQTKPLKERDLTNIELPTNTAIVWGGMPSSKFIQFFNSEMKGFTVYRAQGSSQNSSSEFIKLWQSCDSDLSITLKDSNNWTFDPSNMEIRGCGVNIQKRSQYNTHWPNQDKADKFLEKINNALQKLPKQQEYPVIYIQEK